MALLFTFPCGSCGRRYSVYYPKALLYELSGTAPREMGLAEDEEERRTGAIDAAKGAAEQTGNIWIDASVELERVCECGKKLDFIVQELGREVNTIGSKSSDVPIVEQVVEVKEELERIREQVQNIE